MQSGYCPSLFPHLSSAVDDHMIQHITKVATRAAGWGSPHCVAFYFRRQIHGNARYCIGRIELISLGPRDCFRNLAATTTAYTSIPNTHMLQATHIDVTIVEAAKLWENGPFGLY
ncbi:hypothetical protein N7G274_001160 [Stereocaulon virgatum]|uniref:Uncharacterized protein n=1 Tax=Stereocaulon virgatum TaxID=373712 RepID=A0ABR4ANN7_9LECA